jgi:coatomer subunit beta
VETDTQLSCSNGIRNDLLHPNEYIRGATLRFLCKIKDAELLEPLLSSARQCLEHRHAYVRKNAVLAISSIFQHSEHLIPDAPELILTFLQAENDNTCKRNAFVALSSISHEKALEYLGFTFDDIPALDELTQLALIEFIRKDAAVNPGNKVCSASEGVDRMLTGAAEVPAINIRPSRGVIKHSGL